MKLIILLIILIFESTSSLFSSNPEWIFFSPGHGLPGNDIQGIAIDTNGNKILAIDQSIYIFDGTNWVELKDLANLTKNNFFISGVYIDYHNEIWVSTINAGIFHYNWRKWLIYDTSNSKLPNNNVNCLAFDKFGNNWAGTFFGLSFFNDSNWFNYSKDEFNLTSFNAIFIEIDSNNYKWIGTDEQGLIKLKDTLKMIYNTKNSFLPSNEVWNISIDKNGVKWIPASLNGVVSYNDSLWIIYNTLNSNIPSDNCHFILSDDLNNKWISTNMGLAKFDGINWKIYNSKTTSFPIGSFNYLIMEKNGNLWFSCYNIEKHYVMLGVYREGGVINVVNTDDVEENPNNNNNNFISPNPVTDILYISGLVNPRVYPGDMNVSKIRIFNLMGIEVLSTPASDVFVTNDCKSSPLIPLQRGTIDVSGLPAGVYFIHLGNKVEKFVKM